MAFDPARYELEVIKPLRGLRGRLPDDDLARRYAVEPGMDDEKELAAHLRKVRAYWNQNANGAGSRAQVCKLLQAADDEWQRREGAAMLKPAWWQAQAQRHGQQLREEVARLAGDLSRAYAGLGKITRKQLDDILAHLPALAPAQVDEAVRLAKLQVVDVVALPTESGLDRVAYTQLTQRLAVAGAATVVHLLHPELTKPFTLVRAFGVAGEPGVTLGRGDLDDRLRTAVQLADSGHTRARKEALGILRTGLDAGADLRTVALYHVVERVREKRAQSLADVLLVRTATDLGLTPDDAELLVLSLPEGAAPPSAATRVRELLEEGQLREAQQALTALSHQDPEAAEVRALVAEAHATVERLVREAAAAAAAGREEDAHRALVQARQIARDDEDLDARLRRLPVPPPRDPSAVEAVAAVRLSWQAPNSAAERVRYRVVRANGRPPASPQDGAVVAETASLSCVDSAPPVARHLHYAIFATAGGSVWSRAASCRVVVLPPVADVTLRSDPDPDRVTGTWTAPEGAVAVRVRRTERRAPGQSGEGTRIAGSPNSFVDHDVHLGTEYFYAVTAVYHDERAREVEAAMALVSIVPRAAASAVAELTVEPLAVSGDVARVRLAWPAVADAVVRVRYADRTPSWAEGAVVSVAQVERYGKEAVGEVRQHDHESVLEADVPVGYHVFVPFAIGGTGAVVGRPATVGLVEPVRQLSARRTGTRATLSWVWPADVNLVEVTWSTVDGTAQVWRLTRGQYVDGAGCVITVGQGGGTATVRAIAVGPMGEAVSPPSVTTVDGQALRLSYRVLRPSRLAGLGSAKPWLVRATVDQDCSGVDLCVVVAPGLVLPLRAEQGTVVEWFTDLALAAGVPLDLEVRPPRGLRRPYWIKCFVTRPESSMVTDPPIDEMKVA